MKHFLIYTFSFFCFFQLCGMELPEAPPKKQKMEAESSTISFDTNLWKPCEKKPLALARDSEGIVWDDETLDADALAMSPDGTRCAAFCSAECLPSVLFWSKNNPKQAWRADPPVKPVNLHWLTNKMLALICKDSVQIWVMGKKNKVDKKQFGFPEGFELVPGSLKNSCATSNLSIVCKLKLSNNIRDCSGYIARYTFNEQGEYLSLKERLVENVLCAAIAACAKYTAIIEYAAKSVQSINTKKPTLFLCNEKELVVVKPQELEADSVQAAEFSPDEKNLLIAQTHENKNFVALYSCDKSGISHLLTIPISASITELMWSSGSVNPYIITAKQESAPAYILDYKAALEK